MSANPAPARPVLEATLAEKTLLSASARCFHLRFVTAEPFGFEPGQFVSCVAEDASGKLQTRAYSLASAARTDGFDLCVNRVEGGFFSNRLCDLEPGGAIRFHGPHGLFLLEASAPASLWCADGTGIAPFRSFAQHLFGSDGSRQPAAPTHLLFSAADAESLLYQDEFAAIAARTSGFHFETLVEAAPEELLLRLPARGEGMPTSPQAPAHIWICGLGSFVSPVRARLKELGWDRKAITAERYD